MSSLWRTLARGQRRDIVVMCLTVAVIGVSYGAISVRAGLPIWFPIVLGCIVLAGSSELVFVGILSSGGSPIAALAAGLLLNARHVPYGLTVGDAPGKGWQRLFGSHLINDESVMFTVPQKTPETRRAAFWVSGIGVLLSWPVGALIGGVAGTLIGNPDALGLDVTFPAAVMSLIFPALKESKVRAAALIGAAIALATSGVLPPGLPVLLSLAGLSVFAIRAKTS